MPKFLVQLRREERRVLRTSIVVEADTASAAMDMAEERAADTSTSWRTLGSDGLPTWGPVSATSARDIDYVFPEAANG